MKSKLSGPVLIIILFTIVSCKSKHLIKDEIYLKEVHEKFIERKALAANRGSELFSIFEKELSLKEIQALEFYFAYMPLSDLADYDGHFFLDNIKLSLQAREEMPWGSDIPEEVFMHYVLPMRVNNENLDSFRIKYYDEIQDRIKDNRNIADAALEINHWCHEKVSYQSADIRTSAPMATILSARGRCGEESTFTVAALRTAGIPSRQIYTPRWSHSDDNHAWVEVWDDGDWKFLGACEPEAVLNKGWFTEAASKAMLTHTKAFGKYRGNEPLVAEKNNYAIVNTLPEYADTKTITIKVVNTEKETLADAIVEFQVYNYAEFYPVAKLATDSNGFCSFTTGMGDLMIWASKGDNLGFRIISIPDHDTATIVIGAKELLSGNYEFDIMAPLGREVHYNISQELIEENSLRLEQEDSIRNNYIKSWMKSEGAADLARLHNLNELKIADIIETSSGNYKEISKLISETSDEYLTDMVDMLTLIAKKDLRDTKAAVLNDHIINARKYYHENEGIPADIFKKYILNPRIANEIITPWRSHIQNLQDEETINAFREDPEILIPWINSNIKIKNDENYYGVPISPAGLFELGSSDELSRKILYIACCRSCGIPSRLEPGTLITQYYQNGKWNDVYFEGEIPAYGNDALLSLTYSDEIRVPEYYIHFTIAKLEDGRYNTIKYDYNKKIDSFDSEISLAPGDYMLVTGNRIDESQVLSSMSFFTLKSNEKKELEVILRESESELAVLGLMSIKDLTVLTSEEIALSTMISNGLVIVWIEYAKEPSKHILNDIPLFSSEFDDLGTKFVFLSDPSKANAENASAGHKGMPENTVFGFDNELNILNELNRATGNSNSDFPVLALINRKGEVLYYSDGYQIGAGEKILKTIKQYNKK